MDNIFRYKQIESEDSCKVDRGQTSRLSKERIRRAKKFRKEADKYINYIQRNNLNHIVIKHRYNGRYRYEVDSDCMAGFVCRGFAYTPHSVKKMTDFIESIKHKSLISLDKSQIERGSVFICVRFLESQDAEDFANLLVNSEVHMRDPHIVCRQFKEYADKLFKGKIRLKSSNR